MQLLQLDQKERITAVVRVPPQTEQDFMVMATKLGEVKKTPLKNFANVRRDGLIAMDLEPADELVSAHLASDEDHAIIVSARGQSVRFPVKLLRSASRLSGGVRGIRLASGDRVVGMEIAQPGDQRCSSSASSASASARRSRNTRCTAAAARACARSRRTRRPASSSPPAW